MTDESLWREPDKREKAGGRAVIFVLFGLLVLVAGGYAAAYYTAVDKVPRGTTVASIEIGGRSEAAATQTLRDGLAERADESLEVSVGDLSQTVSPSDAGLSVDYDATIAEAGAQRSWQPAWLWDYFTGGDDVDPVAAVDPAVQAAFLDELAAEVQSEPQEGTLKFTQGGFKTTPAMAGESLDAEGSAAALGAAYLSADQAVTLPLVAVQPDIDAGDLREATDSFANPALSGPVTLKFGKARVLLKPRNYVKALSMQPQDGKLVPVLDTKRLDKLVGRQTADTQGAPVAARIVLEDGKPQVIRSKPGVSYQPQPVHDAFLDLIVASENERSLKVAATVVQPDFTTKDAKALKIRSQVSTFTTNFPYAEYRNINIGRAAELVDGTVLKPGETFSLNGIVGERTRENGFTEGFIISNGIFKEDLGGGVSQMATTAFNAAFFAGLEDVEHKPHSFYIDRYPVGREATVAWPSVDLKFRNDTPYGVLISSKLTPATGSSVGALTVSIYSTKFWDITTSTGERYNFTSPATRTLNTEDCYPNTGYGGFDIDVLRYFRKPGQSELERTEKFETTYTPSDTVICEPPPEPEP